VNPHNSQLWMTFRVFVGLLVSTHGLSPQTVRAQEMTLELDPTHTLKP
jgi:hypothetical protein